jgi:aspartate/methionine/tyrosine aminotransferase
MRQAVLNLEESMIRQVANAAMGRDDVLKFWFGESDEVTPAFIRQAVRLAHDDALLQRLGAAARETALAQQWDAVVAQVETLLKRAMHRAPVMSTLDMRYAGPTIG